MVNATIIKVTKEKDFTQISNAILRSPELSAKAKGLYCFLLSLPPTWTIIRKSLTQYFKDGRESIDTAFKELMEAGYIRQETKRSESGQFQEIKYFFYETKDINPDFNNTENGKLEHGFNATINKEFINKEFKHLSSEQSSEKDYKTIQEIRNKFITQEQYNKLQNVLDKDLLNLIKVDDNNNYIITNNFVENFIELTKMKPLTWLFLEILNSDNENLNSQNNKDLETNSKINKDLNSLGISENVTNSKINKDSVTNTESEIKSETLPGIKKEKKKTVKNKEVTPSSLVKKHYLENVEKLNNAGKTHIVLANVNNQVINTRLKDLLENQKVTVEQLNLALDYAMTQDWHVYEIGYSLQKLLSNNVISTLLNDPKSKVFEKTKQVEMKNIKKGRPKCPECGQDLNGFGECTYCGWGVRTDLW